MFRYVDQIAMQYRGAWFLFDLIEQPEEVFAWQLDVYMRSRGNKIQPHAGSYPFSPSFIGVATHRFIEEYKRSHNVIKALHLFLYFYYHQNKMINNLNVSEEIKYVLRMKMTQAYIELSDIAL